MIPYIHVPDLHLAGLTLHPFGLLVATGVIVGTWLATRRARQRGVNLDLLNSFITWMLVAGFIGGHVLDEIFYHPAEIAKRPYSLLFLWEGLSSFGGFTFPLGFPRIMRLRSCVGAHTVRCQPGFCPQTYQSEKVLVSARPQRTQLEPYTERGPAIECQTHSCREPCAQSLSAQRTRRDRRELSPLRLG